MIEIITTEKVTRCHKLENEEEALVKAYAVENDCDYATAVVNLTNDDELDIWDDEMVEEVSWDDFRIEKAYTYEYELDDEMYEGVTVTLDETAVATEEVAENEKGE